MMRDLSAIARAMRASVSKKLEYRVEFVLEFAGAFAFLFASLASLAVLLEQSPSLGGYTGTQTLLFFGLVSASVGWAELFGDGVWGLGWHVRMGSLDRLLVYPVRDLPFFLACEPQIHGIANVLAGLGIAGASLYATGQPFWAYGLLIFWSLCGGLIYTSILVMASTMLFLMPGRSLDWLWFTNQALNATRYPLSLYPGVIRFIMLVGLPLGVSHYMPGLWLFKGGSALAALAGPPLAAIVWVFLAWRVWDWALLRYESTGS